MALSEAETRRIVTRYQARTASIADRTASRLTVAWLDAGPAFDDLPEFTEAAAVALVVPKQATVRLASALYSTILGLPARTIDPAAVAVPDELREPSIAFWKAINNGATEADALSAGASRAQAVGRNFVVSTGRRTGDAVVANSGQHYGQWRRMTDGNACDWCRGLTRHVWNSAEAADFGHDRCGCTPVPA